MKGKLPFANDGSFFEQFKALQQQHQQQHPEPAAAAAAGTAEVPETSGAGVEPSTSRPQQAVEARAEADTQLGKAAAAAERASTSNQDPDFQPSSSFTGARSGFCFKLGTKGMGYYKDTPLHLQFKQQAAAKPVVLKGNKQIARFGTKAATAAGSDNKKRKLEEAAGASKPAYLREMERYRALSCAADTKHDRPLVK